MSTPSPSKLPRYVRTYQILIGSIVTLVWLLLITGTGVAIFNPSLFSEWTRGLNSSSP